MNKKIKDAVKTGRIKGAIKHLKMFYIEEHERAYEEKLTSEFNSLDTSLSFEEWITQTKEIETDEGTELKYINEIKPLTDEELNSKVESYIPLKEKIKEMKVREIDATAEKIISKYPQYERDTFSTQESEALKFTEDSNADTPLLDAISYSKGIDKKILVDKIMKNSLTFKTIIGALIGKRR